MDKTFLQITSMRDGNDQDYWKQKSYSERLQALEQLRRIVFGYDPATTRLQRIISIAQLKED